MFVIVFEVTSLDFIINSLTRVRVIILKSVIDKHYRIISVSILSCLQNPVFYKSASNYKGICFRCLSHKIIQFKMICHYVKLQVLKLIRLEEQHISNRPICNSRTEYLNVVLVTPMINALFIVDLLSHLLYNH